MVLILFWNENIQWVHSTGLSLMSAMRKHCLHEHNSHSPSRPWLSTLWYFGHCAGTFPKENLWAIQSRYSNNITLWICWSYSIISMREHVPFWEILRVSDEILKLWKARSINTTFKGAQDGNSLSVQWLGLHASSTARDTDSIPSWGNKIPQAVQCREKKKRRYIGLVQNNLVDKNQILSNTRISK